MTVTAQPRKSSVAVLNFGEMESGRRAAERLFAAFSSIDDLTLIDRDESSAAARGAGYAGSLNMTLLEARALGGALGSDFYLTGDAQTIRRSPSTGRFHYEAYASIFIVSARTGRLLTWDRPSFEAPSPEEAEKRLLVDLGRRASDYATIIRSAREEERRERALAVERISGPVTLIEDAPGDEAAAELERLKLPQPYRRLRPTYPETAARAEAEATVDVQLDIDATGEVTRVEIVRWAGFGLDDAAANTVRQLHFSPARRDGVAVPMRVVLRYNFRRRPRESRK